MQITRLIKHADYFSDHIKLNLQGDTAYKTYLGLFLSLVYSALFLAVTITQVQDYMDVSNPIAVTEGVNDQTYPKIEPMSSYLSPILVAWYTEVDSIEVENFDQYFTVLFQKITWEYKTNDAGEEVFTKNFEVFPSIPCKNLTDDQKTRFDFISKESPYFGLLLDYGICTNFPNNLTVEGKGADDFYTLFSMKLLPCSLPSGCKPFDEMTKVNFQLVVPSMNYNTANFHDPLSSTIAVDEIYYVHPGVKQSYLAKLRQQKVADLIGIFPNWTPRGQIYEIGALVPTIQYRSNNVQCTPEEAAVFDNPASPTSSTPCRAAACRS